MLIDILRFLSPLTYLITFIYFYRYFAVRHESYKNYARISELVALALHTLLLVTMTWQTQHLPLAGGFQAISVFMWFFALLNKIYIRRDKEYALGVFHSGIIFILQTIAMIFIDTDAPLPTILQNIYFEVHVVFNLVGYASYSSAFLAGMMYVLLYHEFKEKNLGYFYDRLPALSYIEELNYRALLVGFIFNTVGILLGAYTGKTAWGIYWSWDPKLIAVALAWLIYGVTLVGKINLYWKGMRIASFSIAGFVWIIFSMLIISNYFSKVHTFN